MTPSVETVSYDSPKMGGLRRRPMHNWMKDAVKPSHKGLFKKKAQRAGMSTAAYAKKEAGAGGTLGKEARLARTFEKFRPKKKTLRDHMHHHIAAGAFKKSA